MELIHAGCGLATRNVVMAVVLAIGVVGVPHRVWLDKSGVGAAAAAAVQIIPLSSDDAYDRVREEFCLTPGQFGRDG